MVGLPNFGDRVKIWPFPGRKVQDGQRTLDARGGGRWLPDDGREVIWSEFHLLQLRAGDLLLHSPVAADAKDDEKKASKPGKGQ